MTSKNDWLDRIRRSGQVATHLVKNPAQVLDLARWLRDRRRSTMDTRLPWWPYDAVRLIERWVHPGSRVFEFGGGGSTLWLYDRGAQITCVEHDPDWGRDLQSGLPSDVRLRVIRPTLSGLVGSEESPGLYYDDYVSSIASTPDGTLDLVIVDGRARVACGLAAISKLRRGGLLLLDDSERRRYAPLVNELRNWERTITSGLKIGGGFYVCQTSIWRKP